MHTNLLRITKTYQTQTYDYPAQLQETLGEYGRSFSDRISQATLSPAEKAAADAAALEDPHRRENAPPKTLSHALSRACIQSAEEIGLEEPMGSALFKYATVQEKVGDMRLVMDQEITNKFVTPFGTTMNTQIQAALKARRNVYNTRLALDTAKAQYRNTRPERAEASKVEVEQAEDLFVAALEETMALMKVVLETVSPIGFSLAVCIDDSYTFVTLFTHFFFFLLVHFNLFPLARTSPQPRRHGGSPVGVLQGCVRDLERCCARD